MYLKHYRLARHPFQITPDVNFFYDSRVHRRALATISFGLSKKEGFVVVTGEVGAGKTTLIEYLVTRGNLKDVVIGRISTTQLEAENLLELIAGELGIRKSGASKAAFLRDLNSFFLRIAQSGRSVLLIVDEVQNLSPGALEELRMLSNFQSRERPLVQMLLVGQPEFRARLASPECEQIRQRVIASYHLSPLKAEEIPIYIGHRLEQAGWRQGKLFTEDAEARIFAETDGVPRRINRLCDRLLLYGYLEGLSLIDGRAVDSVAAEMRTENLIGGEVRPATRLEPVALTKPVSEEPPLELVDRVEETAVALDTASPATPVAAAYPSHEALRGLLGLFDDLAQRMARHRQEISRLEARLAPPARRRSKAR